MKENETLNFFFGIITEEEGEAMLKNLERSGKINLKLAKKRIKELEKHWNS